MRKRTFKNFADRAPRITCDDEAIQADRRRDHFARVGSDGAVAGLFVRRYALSDVRRGIFTFANYPPNKDLIESANGSEATRNRQNDLPAQRRCV